MIRMERCKLERNADITDGFHNVEEMKLVVRSVYIVDRIRRNNKAGGAKKDIGEER